jgi:uncharacterized membrane protein
VQKNSEITRRARASLQGKWGLAVGAFFVVFLLEGTLQSWPKTGSLFYLLVGGPFSLGTAYFSLSISRGYGARFEQIFDGFRSFGKALGAFLLIFLYVVLWSLLLIIPGLVALVSYTMTFFIMADNPEIRVSDALKESQRMMRGYKWKFVGLWLRFLGWSLLCLLTLGIGFLWLIPYYHISVACFYEDIKDAPAATLKFV